VIAVRRYRPEDRIACAGVFHRAVHEGAAGHYDAAQRQDWAPSALPDPSRPDKLLHQSAWVAEEGGRITGFMSLMPDGCLDMAFVLPEVMGKGHAAALYDVLLAHARAAGMTRLTVQASEYSRRFLSRRGWRLDGMERLTRPGGVEFDRAQMSLDLTPC
jgi:putative acetyltransferase